MLVDSHCHLHMLDLAPYHGNLSEVITLAEKAGVTHFLCVGTTLEDTTQLRDIAAQFKQVSISVGLHPSEKVAKEPTVAELVALAEHPSVVAIGETGLDYYYNKDGWDSMQDRFRTHIRAARQLQKPLIIHSRGAHADTIRIMREEKADQVRGVMHCFTESVTMAEEAMALGFYISFSGIITFKNAKNVAEVAEKIPLDRLLIETDSPYLAPEPYRGKPNAPQYVVHVAERLAQLKDVSFETIASKTTANYLSLFK